ncbi:GIY-YIG nuclease family protein, partial [Bacteroides acidifaciens]|uniref:GIY-YIG nuclease family protein n=3 Tax=Bacteroidales TaxID=171549 RepID=UPI00259A86DF
VVATWKVYNVKSSTFEALIHKLFAPVQLQVTVDGHRPQEWFIIPFKVIEEAINAIISGKSIEYNSQFKQIIYL